MKNKILLVSRFIALVFPCVMLIIGLMNNGNPFYTSSILGAYFIVYFAIELAIGLEK